MSSFLLFGCKSCGVSPGIELFGENGVTGQALAVIRVSLVTALSLLSTRSPSDALISLSLFTITSRYIARCTGAI